MFIPSIERSCLVAMSSLTEINLSFISDAIFRRMLNAVDEMNSPTFAVLTTNPALIAWIKVKARKAGALNKAKVVKLSTASNTQYLMYSPFDKTAVFSLPVNYCPRSILSVV